MQTRRNFLRDCSLLAATAAVIPGAVLAQSPAVPATAPFGPGFEQFLGQVNTRFVLRTGVRRVRLTLAQAASLPPAAGQAGFSLLFHGPAQAPLPQDTYAFEHPQLGSLTMFIVPVGRSPATHCHYEAVFHRPADPAEFARLIAQAPKRLPAG